MKGTGDQQNPAPAPPPAQGTDIASLLGGGVGAGVDQDPIGWQPQLLGQIPGPERFRWGGIMAREAHPSAAGHQQGSQAPAHQLHAAQQPVAPFRHFDTLPGWQGRPQAAAQHHHRVGTGQLPRGERRRPILQAPDQLAAAERHGTQPDQSHPRAT